MLRELLARSETHPAGTAMERATKTVAADSDVAVALDLAAARSAHWPLPAALLDVWPAGQRPWHVLWETPAALACSVQVTAPMRSELALACEGTTAADKVRAAVDELMPPAKEAVPALAVAMTESLRAGRMTTAVADQYKLLLDTSAAAISGATGTRARPSCGCAGTGRRAR